MALLHVSHPPAQTGGGVDIIYIFFSLIFSEHPEFWTPLQIPIWGPPSWLHPVTYRAIGFLQADTICKEMLQTRKMSVVLESDSVQGPGTWHLRSLSRATNPDLSLDNSSLLCLRTPRAQEARVSGYKEEPVHWPFRRAPTSLANSCLSLAYRKGGMWK